MRPFHEAIAKTCQVGHMIHGLFSFAGEVPCRHA